MVERSRTRSRFCTVDHALDVARRGLSVMHVSAHGVTTIRPKGGFLEVTTEPHRIRGMEYTEMWLDEFSDA